MSGRRSVSTRTAMNRSRTSDATSGSAYVVRSISWQARHHAAVIERRTGFASRAGRATVMLGAAAYSGIAVSGRIGQLQREIGVAPSSLPEGDARRAEFGRLHGLSTALQLVPVLGGLMLMYWEIKE